MQKQQHKPWLYLAQVSNRDVQPGDADAGLEGCLQSLSRLHLYRQWLSDVHLEVALAPRQETNVGAHAGEQVCCARRLWDSLARAIVCTELEIKRCV